MIIAGDLCDCTGSGRSKISEEMLKVVAVTF